MSDNPNGSDGDSANPNDPPLELEPPVDPWTRDAFRGVADNVLPGAKEVTEVGGRGTGTFRFLGMSETATLFGVEIPVAVVAGVLFVLAVVAIGTAIVWGFVKYPKNPTDKQIEARHDIAAAGLNDKPQTFTEALGDDKGKDGQARAPSPNTASSGSTSDSDYLLLVGLWGDCRSEWHGAQQQDSGDPGIFNAPRAARRVKTPAPWYGAPPDEIDMRVDTHDMPSFSSFANAWFAHTTKGSASHYEFHGGSNFGDNNEALGEKNRGTLDINGRTMIIHVHEEGESKNDPSGDATLTLTKKQDYICPAPRNGCSPCFDATTHAPVPKPDGCP
jgi:hypothetical protein